MVPVLHPDDIVLADCRPTTIRTVRPGDIVVAQTTTPTTQVLMVKFVNNTAVCVHKPGDRQSDDPSHNQQAQISLIGTKPHPAELQPLTSLPLQVIRGVVCAVRPAGGTWATVTDRLDENGYNRQAAINAR